jgi:hypothetical protein
MLASAQQQAQELGLREAVRWPGFLDMKKKVHEGNTADIFVNTNHVDNTPVGVIEACAMGLPVVATNVGGIPDLLTNEKTGLWCRTTWRPWRRPSDVAARTVGRHPPAAAESPEDCSGKVRPQWRGCCLRVTIDKGTALRDLSTIGVIRLESQLLTMIPSHRGPMTPARIHPSIGLASAAGHLDLSERDHMPMSTPTALPTSITAV